MTLRLPHDAFPHEIATERLRLRKPRRDEEALYARNAREAYLTRSAPLSEEQARDFASFVLEHWERHGFGFLIVDVEDGEGSPVTVGHAGFRYSGDWPKNWSERHERIELGYSFVPAARGRGYATEASRAVLAAAFWAFDVPRIYANCNRDDPKSAAVLLRLGMTEVESSARRRCFEIARPIG